MNVSTLLEMAADAFGDRAAISPLDGPWTYAELLGRARTLSAALMGHDKVVFLGVNSPCVTLTLFASAIAGKPFVPLNYRLTDEQLEQLLHRCAPAIVIVDADMRHRAPALESMETLTTQEAVALLPSETSPVQAGDDEDIAVMLFTSGTTGEPKTAVLRHQHLTSYVLETTEFMGAADDECALISVPPYHIAGISAALTSTYVGRRVVQLATFDAERWVNAARRERVTHAMVVPTMMARIVEVLARSRVELPTLRHLSYGGGPMPLALLESALTLLPHVDFVNAYGLTETSSTIAILTPEDHRQAMASEQPGIRARLSSVGRPISSIELEVRDAAGAAVAPGHSGEIFVRGPQVSGEYREHGAKQGGWFATRDAGHRDADGYLFLEGRLDDIIVRGGENISPGEIERILAQHPSVAESAVVGFPHEEWGEGIAAFVVLRPDAAATEPQLKDWVQRSLRSSRRPDRIVFTVDLPYNETGKLLRRVMKQRICAGG